MPSLLFFALNGIIFIGKIKENEHEEKTRTTESRDKWEREKDIQKQTKKPQNEIYLIVKTFFCVT